MYSLKGAHPKGMTHKKKKCKVKDVEKRGMTNERAKSKSLNM